MGVDLVLASEPDLQAVVGDVVLAGVVEELDAVEQEVPERVRRWRPLTAAMNAWLRSKISAGTGLTSLIGRSG